MKKNKNKAYEQEELYSGNDSVKSEQSSETIDEPIKAVEQLTDKDEKSSVSKKTSKIKVKKLKKILLISISAFILIFAVLSVLDHYLKKKSPKIGFTEKQSDIFYFPEDYSENIYDDIIYMNRFREMKYDYLGEAIWVNEENYNQQTSVARFFYDYFQTVINGRYDQYEDFFSDDFFHRHSIPDKFTKQKIYDIEVSLLDSEAIDNVIYETYKVGYKIYENNGSFRADVRSEECKPVAIRVMIGSKNKITSIIPIIDK